MMEWPGRYVLLDIKNSNTADIMNFMRPVFDEYDYDFSSQVYIAPWSQQMLNRAAEQLPGLPTSLISSALPNVNTAVDSFNVNFNSVRLNTSWVRSAQSQGKKVFSWTINSESLTREAFEIQIDGAVTDFVSQCESIRASFENRV
jgi:glycerophosphoryl diester phosphodiesterase